MKQSDGLDLEYIIQQAQRFAIEHYRDSRLGTTDFHKEAAPYVKMVRQWAVGVIQDLDRHSDSRAAELECSEDGYTFGLDDAKAAFKEEQ